VESCNYRHTVDQRGGVETAHCGFIEELLDKCSDGLGVVERGVCESCRRSFLPTVQNPNPVVASVLYARALKQAVALPPGAQVDRLRAVAQRASACLDVMYESPLTIEPAPAGDVRTLAQILPPPALRHGPRVRYWAIGVTTAPRIQPVLSTCLESLARAGWQRPHLFIDSSVHVPAPHDRLPCTFRDERVGAWPNYFLTLAELLLGHPRADAYMVVQDDALFYDRQSLTAYLETVFWPGKEACLVSLYCSPLDSGGAPGWHSCNGVMRSGPHAVAFPRELAKAFVTDRAVFEHRWDRDELAATSIGDVISEWAANRGVPVWLPTPSLVKHIGDTSTIWPMIRAKGNRQAVSFASEECVPEA
jgi:hypothetical protein